jgi:hypothetical protein
VLRYAQFAVRPRTGGLDDIHHLRVVGIVVSNEDEPSVLIVEDGGLILVALGEAEPTHPQGAPDLDPVTLNGCRSS